MRGHKDAVTVFPVYLHIPQRSSAHCMTMQHRHSANGKYSRPFLCGRKRIVPAGPVHQSAWYANQNCALSAVLSHVTTARFADVHAACATALHRLPHNRALRSISPSSTASQLYAHGGAANLLILTESPFPRRSLNATRPAQFPFLSSARR